MGAGIKIYRPGNTNNIIGNMSEQTAAGLYFHHVRRGSVEETPAYYSLGGMRTDISGIFFNGIDFAPSRNDAQIGQVYLDGETLRVRKS